MTKYLLLAATAIALASPALAQRGPQQTPEERAAAFVKADANKDGKLDKAELKMTLPEQFQAQVDDERLGQMLARRDADKDGFVSKAEWDAPPPPRPAQ